VSGIRDKEFTEQSYVRKIYPREISGSLWSAIQVATAAGLCSVLDIVLSDLARFRGFIPQESIALGRFMGNRFGEYYA